MGSLYHTIKRIPLVLFTACLCSILFQLSYPSSEEAVNSDIVLSCQVDIESSLPLVKHKDIDFLENIISNSSDDIHHIQYKMNADLHDIHTLKRAIEEIQFDDYGISESVEGRICEIIEHSEIDELKLVFLIIDICISKRKLILLQSRLATKLYHLYEQFMEQNPETIKEVEYLCIGNTLYSDKRGVEEKLKSIYIRINEKLLESKGILVENITKILSKDLDELDHLNKKSIVYYPSNALEVDDIASLLDRYLYPRMSRNDLMQFGCFILVVLLYSLYQHSEEEDQYEYLNEYI